MAIEIEWLAGVAIFVFDLGGRIFQCNCAMFYIHFAPEIFEYQTQGLCTHMGRSTKYPRMNPQTYNNQHLGFHTHPPAPPPPYTDMTMFFRDIIEHIVNHLRHDKPALARLRLVSHVWDAPCLALVFRRLDFIMLDPLDYMQDEDGGNDALLKATQASLKRCHDLLELLRARPELSSVPREILLARAHRVGPSVWPQLEEVHTDIFRRLNRIQTVHLQEIRFSHLSGDFFDALVGICQQPTVTHLNITACLIDNSQLVGRLILSAEYLQHLKISLFSVYHTMYTQPPQLDRDYKLSGCAAHEGRRRRIRPRVLISEHKSLSALSQYLLDPDFGLDLSELKELRLTHVDNDSPLPTDAVAMAYTFWSACATSLNFLEFESPVGMSTQRFFFFFFFGREMLIFYRKAVALSQKSKSGRVTFSRCSPTSPRCASLVFIFPKEKRTIRWLRWPPVWRVSIEGLQ